MPSRREAVLDAVVAALNGAGKPSKTTVHRSRFRPIHQGEGTKEIVVYPISEAVPEPHATQTTHRRLRVRLEYRKRLAGLTDVPDEQLDELLVWGVKALMADTQLGGVAGNVAEVSTGWEGDPEDPLVAAAATDFDIDYFTNWQDPEAL